MSRVAEDLIGRWFLARRHHGVDDTMYFAVVDGRGEVIASRGYAHARFDGRGALIGMLKQMGVTFRPPQIGQGRRAPGWWALLRSRPWRQPSTPIPDWREPVNADRDRTDGFAGLQIYRFRREATMALEQQAAEQGVSLTALILAAEHRAISALLCQTGSRGSWFVPVDLRGSVSLSRDSMNHCSGVFVTLADHGQGSDVHRQLKARLKAGAHWWYWFQARLLARLGQAVVNRAYASLARPGRYLGSYSMLGRWQVDWRGSDFPEDAALVCCGPGSPTYPFANGVILTNGCLTLAMKPDPSLGLSADQSRTLMARWLEELTVTQSGAQPLSVAQEQAVC